MNGQAPSLDLERFRNAIIQRVGLQFDDAKLGFLGEVLQRRLDKLGHASDPYLWRLQHEPSYEELNALARELTVGETYFFRNIEQFRALADVVLPERMAMGRTPRTLRLLSAGCASGEEAYTLAMVARDAADPSWEILIRAVDLNPAALEKASRAHYSPWALRETPPEAQHRWFRPDGRELVLDATLRAMVKFQVANLASGDPGLWLPEIYDVVFCRNVLMYFAPEQMRATVARIAGSLAPGGFLFLGHAETLRGVSDAFHLRHTHGTFYYERKGRTGRSAESMDASPTLPAIVAPVAPANDGWFHTISRASERIAALVPVPSAGVTLIDLGSVPWDMAPALDLLRKERFAEALHHVRKCPPAAGRDPDVLLLEAALLAHSGQTKAAEDVSQKLLLIDELNAGAHYVLGLCREQSADLDAAAEHYRTAAYLDQQFAMPRLHLGLLARRAGKRDAARRELSQALDLLQREDGSRLLLFGGGFNREALTALCRSVLKEAGGPR